MPQVRRSARRVPAAQLWHRACRYERELEQQGREALAAEQQRAEEMRRRIYVAEQEWRARMEATARAQPAPPSPRNRVASLPPGHVQLQVGARAFPAATLATAAELVGGLRAIPPEGREVIFRAMSEALNRR